MKTPKSVTEHPKHFEVTPQDGPAFKVAKKGLSPKVLGRMQGLCMGGAVKKMADGGAVPDFSDVIGGEPQAARDFWAQYQPQLAAAEQANPALGNDFVGSGTSSQAIVSPANVSGGEPMETVPIGQLSAHPVPGVADAGASAAAFDQAGAPAPAAPPMPSAPGIGGGPDESKKLQGIEQERMDSAKQAAGVEQQYAAQAAKANQDAQDAMAAKQAIHDEEAKKIQTDLTQAENDVKNGKIDPNNWFGSKDTGGKMSAILGLVLGGLGSGLTRGPNVALDLMNKQIDRDLLSQKENLQQKNNLVAMYYKKLGNLDEAMQMSKATILTGLNLKVAGLASMAKGAMAKANLAAVQAAIQQDTIKVGSDLATARSGRRLQNIHAAIGEQQLAAGQQAAAQQGNTAQIMDRLYSGTASPQDQATLDAMTGGKASERIVSTPEGGRALAHDPKSAEKYREADSAFKPVRQSIQELKNIEKQLSVVTLDPATRSQIQDRRNFLIMELPKVIGGVNRLNENELHLADKSVKDAMNSLTSRRGAVAALDTLDSLVGEKQTAMADTYLIRPSKKKIDQTRE